MLYYMKRKDNIDEAMGVPIIIKLRTGMGDIENKINEDTMRVIKHEYATKYLESMGVNPTVKNINAILKYKPLSDCTVETAGEVI